MERLSKVLKQLRSEEEQVLASYEASKADAKRFSGELQKIRKAIATLDGSENKKPTVTTKDVVGILFEALKQGPLEVEQAKRVVARDLEQQGKSKNGIALRFKQAVSKFEERDGVLHPKPPVVEGARS